MGDDKGGDASNSDWDNAAMAMLAGGAYKGLFVAGALGMGEAFKMPFKIGMMVSVVQELAVLYLVNNADGTTASDTNSTNISYALAATNLLVSAGAVMAAKGMDDDEEEEDDGEAEDDEAADDDYGYGFYGYGGYGYYY